MSVLVTVLEAILTTRAGGGGDSISKGRGCLSSRLGLSISDFGLTWGVLGKTPLYLAINVSFRVAREETLQNYSFSICFISSIHVIRVLNGLFRGQKKDGPCPDWSPLGD